MMVKAAPGIALDGIANVSPGSTLSIQAQSSSGTPFIKSTTATVSQNGRFRTVLDFGGLSPGTEFTLTVRYNNSTLIEQSGVVLTSSHG
ncbi:BGTF surface domain-containing protein [Halospeciosus flavus]